MADNGLNAALRGYAEPSKKGGASCKGLITTLAARMQAALNPEPLSAQERLETVCWPSRTATRSAAGAAETPTSPHDDLPLLELSGPCAHVHSFLRYAEVCAGVRADAQRAAKHGRAELWPIFVLSRGRPRTAHLDWAAGHVLGSASPARACERVVIVVAPEDRDEYRRYWPGALLATLPEEGRPVGCESLSWLVCRVPCAA